MQISPVGVCTRFCATAPKHLRCASAGEICAAVPHHLPVPVAALTCWRKAGTGMRRQRAAQGFAERLLMERCRRNRAAGGDTWEPVGEGWPWRVAGECNMSGQAPPDQPAPVLQQDGPRSQTAGSHWGACTPRVDFTCAPAMGARWGRGGSGRRECCLMLLLHPFL